MSRHDISLKSQFKRIIESNNVGQELISFFDKLPQESYRRAIYILSIIYPVKLNVSDDEFKFIFYIMSQKKFLRQQTISDFVRSINLIEFTETQKSVLRELIKKNNDIIITQCTFELDCLLTRVSASSNQFRNSNGYLPENS
ncbi:Uncharacterised protein [Escherichia coli]|uniref:hypothetical protein n=1 Tax=Escherichia coli TaxID=562 RepID=UPI000B7EBCCD|nr:hypothetical protein [Escherichia coli]CAD5688401.1 Uncharacterised protein [Escherichia coli]CAD5714051.1 Uncharacterised protein [Escherichia coli]CAD5746322.1 Uncharacterised protein [Escherichia coli]